MLRSHTEAYRQADWVAGAIYFDYNDYRTHIGDKGQGEFKQRVHGVVDLMGRRKPSWQVLREETSPIRLLRVRDVEATGSEKARAKVEIVTRSLENDLPAYTLRGYELIWKAEDEYGRPMGTGRVALPDLAPGSRHVEAIEWPAFEPLTRIHAEVFRPTGYSVLDAEWVRAGGGE
jgi:beta-glucuronidase